MTAPYSTLLEDRYYDTMLARHLDREAAAHTHEEKLIEKIEEYHHDLKNRNQLARDNAHLLAHTPRYNTDAWDAILDALRDADWLTDQVYDTVTSTHDPEFLLDDIDTTIRCAISSYRACAAIAYHGLWGTSFRPLHMDPEKNNDAAQTIVRQAFGLAGDTEEWSRIITDLYRG